MIALFCSQELRGEVRTMLPRHLVVGLGAEGPRPGVPLGVLRVRRLPPPAVLRGGVRPPREPGALQNALHGDPGPGEHGQ